MVTRKTWKDFKDVGLLWWVNMLLHTFGWAIVLETDDLTDEVVSCYPARVKFRGFSESVNSGGYVKVSEYMHSESATLLKESKE